MVYTAPHHHQQHFGYKYEVSVFTK